MKCKLTWIWITLHLTSSLNSSLKINNTNYIPQIDEMFSFDCLGQHICKLLLNADMNNLKYFIITLIAKKMLLSINVLTSSMQNWILGKTYGWFVVYHQPDWFAHLELQFMHQIHQSNNLTNWQRTSYVFNFRCWQYNHWLLLREPKNRSSYIHEQVPCSTSSLHSITTLVRAWIAYIPRIWLQLGHVTTLVYS